MYDVFSELSLVIAVTVAVSIFMRLIRQPLILGYILAGLLVGPSALGLIRSTEMFEAFSSIGIALLLFIIGLGMNISELKKLGKVVIVAAMTSFFMVGLLGFNSALLLGFSKTEAVLMGLALFFSSTIIIIKILSDKKEQNRLHGQIAIGVILLEDVVATFALLFIVAGKDGGLQVSQLGLLAAKAFVLMGLLAFCSLKVLPRLGRFVASSQELLFLFAIAWGFGIATIFKSAGFSIEVGALFAGVALASLPYASEIGARLKPLRDFFVVLFFIVLGERLNVSNLADALLPALLFSAIVIFVKPFAITFSMGMLGYAKRVSFKTGINLSQISEFSIILVVLGTTAGMVRPEISAIVTLVAIITIATSTYLMHYDDELFARFDRIKLHLFEKETVYKEKRSRLGYPLILFGYHHGGHEFIRTFKDIGKRYIVVDYDPNVIENLERQRIPYMYGDAADVELLEEVGVENAKLVISTFTDFDITEQLVRNVARINPKAVIICHADNIVEAVRLYDTGATYVMIPHYIGTEKASSFIKKSGLKKSEFKKYREKHLAYLQSHYEVNLEE